MEISIRDINAHWGAPYDQDAAATRGDFEQSLAWDLADSATPILNQSSKTALFTMLGAGESRAAIIHVLKTYAATGEVAPAELTARVTTWVDGYVGADIEGHLRETANRASGSSGCRPSGSTVAAVHGQKNTKCAIVSAGDHRS